MRFSLGVFFCLVTGSANAQVPPQSGHDRTFWREIVAHQYQIPDGQAVMPLALELAAFVGSPDPELRDSFGYEILANWIHRSGKFSADDLDMPRRTFLPQVLVGIGESGTDTVFRRSFALLNLKELAASDLRIPFLSRTDFDGLVELAVKAFRAEKDNRGYIAEKGWAHATAHGADLLRILARNDKLSLSQQSQLLAAIVTRVRAATSVFVWGEDARLAAALASLANRPDFDPILFDAWFVALRAENLRLWREPFDAESYARVRVQVNTLTHFAALVARQNNPAFPVKLRDALQSTLAAVN